MIPRRSRRTGTLLADTARPQGSLVLYALLLCALALGTPAAAQEEPGSPGSPLLRDQPIAADSGGSAETDADAVESAQPAVAEPLELPPEPVPKRLFGIIPNYRANVTLENYVPLTPSEKFRIARKDSFDWPNFFLLTGYAIQAQVAHGGFTHNGGMPVFGEFYARAFGDAVISSYVTEAILPTLLHEDPRFFRLGKGTFWHRTGYVASRLFVTRTDNGGTRFNFSEIAGNAAVVAIASTYYPDSQSVGDGIERYGIQLGNDFMANLLTEFWPDIKHHLPLRRH
jgi:hypothetical protein